MDHGREVVSYSVVSWHEKRAGDVSGDGAYPLVLLVD